MFSYASFTLVQSRNSVFCRSAKLWKSDMRSDESVNKKNSTPSASSCRGTKRVSKLGMEIFCSSDSHPTILYYSYPTILITPLETLDMWLLKSFLMNWCLHYLDVYISSLLLQFFCFNCTKHFLFNIYKTLFFVSIKSLSMKI